MLWMDFTIDQAGQDFKVKGDWEGEVMGVDRDGNKKETCLYQEGDIFVVDKNGWLRKVATKEDNHEI